MQHCETCGNSYDHLLEITVDGATHVFDCFECAIHALAPTCGHCKVRVIGHGVQVDQTVYCCAHCADMEERAAGVRDRV
ncbi:MAG: hypothetical protein WD273_04915 [Trueperaceae bacterium]